jgi:phenylpyruvate tautomerase PptA (4-oxalocrotonate tautomerase family)
LVAVVVEDITEVVAVVLEAVTEVVVVVVEDITDWQRWWCRHLQRY